jgi:hypothetical protein
MATIRPEVTGRRALAREKREGEGTEEDDADPVDDSKSQPLPDDRSKTITQFCRAEQMSRPFYFKLRKRGLGPRELREGRFIRITPEAHAEWRRARECSQVGSTVANSERAPPGGALSDS